MPHDITVGIRFKRINERRGHLVELAYEPRVSLEVPLGILDKRGGRAARCHGHGRCRHRDEGRPYVAIIPSRCSQARECIRDAAHVGVIRREGPFRAKHRSSFHVVTNTRRAPPAADVVDALALQASWAEAARENGIDATFLIGNHDFEYLLGEGCSGTHLEAMA